MSKFINKKSLKYGSNSLIMIIAAVAIVLMLNIILSPGTLKKITGKDTLKLDLTPNKIYSLGDVTKDILKGLKKDVDIYVLYNDDPVKHSDAKNVMEFLNQYEKYGHVKVQRINPEKNPGIIASIDPEGVHDLHEDNIIVKSGKSLKIFFTEQLYLEDMYNANGTNKWDGEQVITGAIKYVTADKKSVIYYSMGHEERNLYDEFKTLKNYIEKNSCEVKQLNLLKEVNIPDDAEIIIFTSPKLDLTADEKGKVDNFLRNGGKAMFMFDYQEKDLSLPHFEELMRTYGISVNNDKVRDTGNNSLPQNNYYLVVLPMNNIINANLLGNGTALVIPNARSLNILKNNKENLSVAPLLQTSSSAVGEQINKSNGNNYGPLNLAIAAEYKVQEKTSRVVVVGNSSFVSDDFVSKYPFSVNFIINTVNWMQDNRGELPIQPKSLEFGTLQISQSQANISRVFITFILPLLILGAGMIVWMKRRHL